MSSFSKVSIVIPTYNSAQYLSETIESAMASSYANLEILVVDDGSTDDSQEILKTWTSRYPDIIKVYTQSNQGPSIARNFGIYQATGKYVLPLDSDDKIHPEYISMAVERFERDEDVKVVYCEAEKFGVKQGHWKLKPFSLSDLALDNMIFVSALFKKSDWKKAGGYDPRFVAGWEDWEFWINMLKNGGKVEKLPVVGFFYRIRKGSRRKSTDRAGKLMTIELLNRKHSDFFERHLSGPLRNPRGVSRIVNPILNLTTVFSRRVPSTASSLSIKRQ